MAHAVRTLFFTSAKQSRQQYRTDRADGVTRQAVSGALTREEGYGRAWVAAYVPFVVGTVYFGGAWTFGLNYSRSSKAFGLVSDVEFDTDPACGTLNDWLAQLPGNRSSVYPEPIRPAHSWPAVGMR